MFLAHMPYIIFVIRNAHHQTRGLISDAHYPPDFGQQISHTIYPPAYHSSAAKSAGIVITVAANTPAA
jgi:hypothetical protein